jgi:hypothetical protein
METVTTIAWNGTSTAMIKSIQAVGGAWPHRRLSKAYYG